MIRCAIVLIHNGDLQRVTSARRVIEAIRVDLGASEISTESFEIHQQPEVKAISRTELCKLTILESMLQINYFRNYLALSSKYWLPYVGAIFRSVLAPFSSSRERRKRNIESIITGKHFQSWQICRNFDFLMVFEDDVIQTGPLDELVQTARDIATLDKSVPTYIDLAGGYPQDKVISKSRVSSNLEIGKLFTNTACGYVINGRLADDLVAFYRSNPLVSMLGIDFFLNAAFSSSRTKLGFCLHLEKSGLSHGSFTGVFRSWTEQAD